MKHFTLLLLLALPALTPSLFAKEIKIHGYITDLKSPTEFQIDEYRINRDATLEVDLEKDENDPKAPITFTPSDLRVGSEVEIKGELDDTGIVRAQSVRVYLTDHKTVSRTALLDQKPALERSGQAWQGDIRTDGQTVTVKPSTKVTFLRNAAEKKIVKSARKAATQKGKDSSDAEPGLDEEETGDPLQSLESVVPDTWVTYKGTRQPNGSIVATTIQFKHNELEPGEARLMKDLTPRLKALKSSGGELTIQKVGKFRLYPDEEVQAYVRQLGNKLIPEYQRSMALGSADKINFQFFVVDQKVTNAFALANGTVVIYSRIFELLENEAQLAAVVGHEMSHAIQEHTYRQMQYHKKALLALRIGGAIAASRGNYSLANAATLIEAAVRNGYSRSLENQADRFGLEYMINAGYDPREAPRVWKVLTLAEGDKPTNFFWSTHDNNTTRRSYLMAELKNNYADLDYSRVQKGEGPFAAVAARVKSRAQGSKKSPKVGALASPGSQATPPPPALPATTVVEAPRSVPLGRQTIPDSGGPASPSARPSPKPMTMAPASPVIPPPLPSAIATPNAEPLTAVPQTPAAPTAPIRPPQPPTPATAVRADSPSQGPLAKPSLAAAELPYFSLLSAPPGPWPAVLSSIGLQSPPAGVSTARVTVALPGSSASPDWPKRVEAGAILILEGASPLADSFGIRPGPTTVHAGSLRDIHQPGLSIVWENPLDLPVFTLPAAAMVFTRDRWTGAPLTAGLRRGSGAVLWVAVSPGERGYERFPYLLDALCDIGLDPPFRSSRLWAFFDSAYRSRVDVDYFAARWRKSGIAALHVAAWHFFEPDSQGDAYLKRLIQACHREGIQVYAWLELPHVSEKFWSAHPEWREKTAVLQDAELDWRKLMNLTNRDCFRAVSAGVRQLLARFDWDGVNLAELYFESLHGIDDPSRFTPMNLDVRAQFELKYGHDPLDLFRSRKDDAAARQRFLDFRADLAARIEEEWIGELEKARDPKSPNAKPDLDLVLTHVDDRFDPHMREALGADAARALPLLDKHSFTFLIEDPATVWNLGPQRYETIADRYRALTGHAAQLAIDVNIVDRYQNVYPTKQQTGTELFQIVHQAARNFARVALYFESSLAPPDLKLLPSAASAVTRIEKAGRQVTVDSLAAVGLPWKGAAIVDGLPWPVADDETVWLPAGLHTVEPDAPSGAPRVLRLNAEVRSARVTSPAAVEVTYDSAARALAVLDRPAMSVKVDGASYPVRDAGGQTLFLPRGHHVVAIECAGPHPW